MKTLAVPRRSLIISVILLGVLMYIGRLYYVQVVNDRYKLTARNQAFVFQTDYPPRGVIYDRNGKLLVFNQEAYDLMCVPRNMKGCDTLSLCNALGIDTAEFNRRLVRMCGTLENAKHDYRNYIFEGQVPPELNATIQEKLYKFKGFWMQNHTVRKYAYPVAAHLLGYIGEVDEKTTKENPYYKSGDYIGISGIEKGYETYLRGKKGVSIKMRDVHNNIKGSYAAGKYDTAAVPGLSLTSTLDADLQEYGEQLMQNKIGGCVAIEPSTGEILALITSPTYDPNLLVGRDRPKNYAALARDTVGVPLFNRALQAYYPPGSTFKLLNALVGQQEGVLNTRTAYPCAAGYPPLGGHPACESHASPLQLTEAIQHSCNSYFSYVLKSIMENRKYKTFTDAYAAWRNYVMSFGVGKKIGTDLPFELKGIVPSVEYYNKVFGVNGWKANTVVGAGLGIGQGELSVTPLQMCNITATIANRGYYYTPHVIRSIGEGKDKIVLPQWAKKNYTLVTDTSYYNNVVNAMAEVVRAGTGKGAQIPGIEICGKTGTAQNPHGKDHSVFVCFAPKENPKIAVAVLVENAGWGWEYGVPIASLLVEKYLKGTITRTELEKRMLEADLIHTTKP